MSSKSITSKDLRLAMVPYETAGIQKIMDFSCTYNAYEEQPSLSTIYRITEKKRHDTLDQLRTCLFIAVRDEWKLGPLQFLEDSDQVRHLRLLIQKIRLRLVARAVVLSQLNKKAEEE